MIPESVRKTLSSLPQAPEGDPREGRLYRRLGEWAGFPKYGCPDENCAMDSLDVETVVQHFTVAHLGIEKKTSGKSSLLGPDGKPADHQELKGKEEPEASPPPPRRFGFFNRPDDQPDDE